MLRLSLFLKTMYILCIHLRPDDNKINYNDEPTIEHVKDALHDPVSRHVIVPEPGLRLYPASQD